MFYKKNYKEGIRAEKIKRKVREKERKRRRNNEGKILKESEKT